MKSIFLPSFLVALCACVSVSKLRSQNGTATGQAANIFVGFRFPTAADYPPATPANLEISTATSTQLVLSWSAAAAGLPNRAIDHYDVLRNGLKVGETHDTRITVNYDPTGAALEFFAVRAVDERGLVSPVGPEIRAPRDVLDVGRISIEQQAVTATRINRAFRSSFESDRRYKKGTYTFELDYTYNDFDYYTLTKRDERQFVAAYDPNTGKWGLLSASGGYLDRLDIHDGSPPVIDSGIWLPVAGYPPLVELRSGATLKDTWVVDENAFIFGDEPITDSYAQWGDLHERGLTTITLDDEFTDEEWRSGIDDDYATGLSLLETQSWDSEVVVSFGAAELDSDSGNFFGVARREEYEDEDTITLKGGKYRLHVPGTGRQTIRWAEVSTAYDGSEPIVVVREEAIDLDHSDGYSQVYTVAPPLQPGETDIVILNTAVSLKTPSFTPTSAGPQRLFMANALFEGEAGEIAILTAGSGLFQTATVTYAEAEDVIRLVAINPRVEANDGLAAAIAGGEVISSGTDLAQYSHQPGFYGFGGWKLVAVGQREGTATVQLLLNTGYAAPVTHTFTVSVYPEIHLAVDADRNGAIRFAMDSSADLTSAAEPFRFWLNDDNDVSFHTPLWIDADPERYPPAQRDSANQRIDGVRDCEDLSRIWLNADGFIDRAKDPASDMYLGLKWRNTNGTHPSIRLFRSADPNGGLGHINDARIGAQQVGGVPNSISSLGTCLGDADAGFVGATEGYPWSGITQVEPSLGAADFVFRKDVLADIFAGRPTGYLLFEGVQEGKGELVPVIVRRKSDGTWETISEGGSAWLQLDNIRRMYVRVHSEPIASNFPFPWQEVVATFPPPFPYTESLGEDHALSIPDQRLGYGLGDTEENLGQFPFVPTAGEQKKCVVFVHGIGMTVPEMNGYSESFYKRLWWEGYRGRFVSFRWSTPPLEGFLTPLLDRPNVSLFNSGEYRAWKSGAALRKYVEGLRSQLGATAIIGVAAHSLGNVVASEALRQGMRPHSYVAMEAAVPLSCYYSSDPANLETPPANLRLVNAEQDNPTPRDASEGGYHGYLASLRNIPGLNRVNYYNANDFWLATGTTSPLFLNLEVDWVTNQASYKPDNRYGPGKYSYNVELNSTRFRRGPFFSRAVTDPDEKMAFVARSRTSAFGVSLPPPGFSGLNLSADYGFDRPRPDHSGQFQRNIQLMYADENGMQHTEPLYARLMRDLRVNP